MRQKLPGGGVQRQRKKYKGMKFLKKERKKKRSGFCSKPYPEQRKRDPQGNLLFCPK